MEQNYLWIKNGLLTYRVELDSIQFVSANGHYCKVHTSLLTTVVNCTFGELLEVLPPELLTRIHRCYAINVQHVTGISRTRILIHNIQLPVGKSYVKALQGKLFNSG